MDYLFDTYQEDLVRSIFGDKTTDLLKADDIKKPFCDIALDFNKAHNKQTATVVSTARLTSKQQKVYYLLKWDSTDCIPGGNHLGQKDVDYTGRFVEDKDINGHPITIPKEGYLVYYENDIFYFSDTICQERDMNGRWTFMIMVTDKDGNALCKKTIDLNW